MTFNLKIFSTEKIIYEGDVKSLFVQGDKSEFELLPFHHPLMSVIDDGNIILDWEKFFSVKNGVLKFIDNECVVLTD